MKKTTLRLSNRGTLYIGLSAMTFFFHSKSFSQTTEIPKSTGELRSIQVPQFANEAERQEWILKHPEEYQFLIGSFKKEDVNGQSSLPSDFPKFVNTGNPELDNQNYSKEKAIWINEHPDLYKKMQEPTTLPSENKNN
jgi:hypothetical protein